MGVLSNKNVFITGANTGIGKETALALAELGAHVTIASRSRQRTQPVLDMLEAKGAAYDFIELDLCALESVRQCVATFSMKERSIHVLINNAGIGGTTGITEDGYELTFGVNHIGPFLLTTLLLPYVKEAATKEAPARIVNVASMAHYRVQGIDYAVVERRSRGFLSFRNYMMSKLANILHVKSLAARLQNDHIQTYALHPGVIASDIWRGVPWPIRPLLTAKMLDEKQGAKTTIFCASSEDPCVTEHSGEYYDKCTITKPSRPARSEKLAEELWHKSVEWCGDASAH